MKEFREKVKQEEKENEACQAAQADQLNTEGIHIAVEAEPTIPLSFKRPGEQDIHPFESSQMGNQHKRRRQGKCLVAGTTVVSCSLSEYLIALADNIDLYTPKLLLQPTANCRYTIQQRTEGWTIEKQ
ncbi:uncharacterized protein LOC110818188 [Carica papaya]|uniref:uncharacterized protein LOC110818188 n=1 Tax=Carica papaya TaxID=3649 RepID=UPI000B8C7794|nr:uncharacterized protein LOC110818188 [Carica papaya]